MLSVLLVLMSAAVLFSTSMCLDSSVATFCDRDAPSVNRMFSEKSENIKGLDSGILNRFALF